MKFGQLILRKIYQMCREGREEGGEREEGEKGTEEREGIEGKRGEKEKEKGTDMGDSPYQS